MPCSNFTAEQCLELVDLTTNAASTFDPELTNVIFYACLNMWAIGLGVGIVFSLIRKLK
jgi:maleate cis-trans isomerase